MGNGSPANRPFQTESPDITEALDQEHMPGLSELCHEQRDLLFGETAQISCLAKRGIEDSAFQKRMPLKLQTLRRMNVVVETMASLDKPSFLRIGHSGLSPVGSYGARCQKGALS